MPKRLKMCKECGKYTISPVECPSCKGELASAYPPKFSLEDKYQKYRIPHFLEKMQKDYGIVPSDEKD